MFSSNCRCRVYLMTMCILSASKVDTLGTLDRRLRLRPYCCFSSRYLTIILYPPLSRT